MKKWEFIIDTNCYVGNFDREICAYITGHINSDFDEKGGDRWNLAELFKNEIGYPEEFFESITTVPVHEYKDLGNYACIENYDSQDNNSVGIFFYERPTLKMINLLKCRCYQFAKMRPNVGEGNGVLLKILGFRLICIETKINEVFI